MNHRSPLQYILLAIVMFCLTSIGRHLQFDSQSDYNYKHNYKPVNPSISLYHAQCANAPTIAKYVSDSQVCYAFQTNIQIYWVQGHPDYWTKGYDSPYRVASPPGFEALVDQGGGTYENDVLDLSRKDIKPVSGIGLAEVWQGSVTKIVLNGQSIKTYNNPELDFEKDYKRPPDFGLWWFVGIAIACIAALIATRDARNIQTRRTF